MKLVNDLKLLTIFSKSSIVDVWQVSKNVTNTGPKTKVKAIK